MIHNEQHLGFASSRVTRASGRNAALGTLFCFPDKAAAVGSIFITTLFTFPSIQNLIKNHQMMGYSENYYGQSN